MAERCTQTERLGLKLSLFELVKQKSRMPEEMRGSLRCDYMKLFVPSITTQQNALVSQVATRIVKIFCKILQIAF